MIQNTMVTNMGRKSLPKRKTSDATHNLFGQRLGRKGQATREGILTAALRIIESSDDTPITLSNIAREMSMSMTTLYLYFPDLGDLALAVLSRVMETAETAFVDRLRSRWPDSSLHDCCLEFLHAHFAFWRSHARILQIRNAYADTGDVRFLEYRNRVSRPLIECLIGQMDGQPASLNSPEGYLATLILTGFERIATVITNSIFHISSNEQGVSDETSYVEKLINVEADMIACLIRKQRDEAMLREDYGWLSA